MMNSTAFPSVVSPAMASGGNPNRRFGALANAGAQTIGDSIARKVGRMSADLGGGALAANLKSSAAPSLAGAGSPGGGMTLGQMAAKIAQDAGVFIQQLKSLPTANHAGVEAAHKQIQQGFIALLQAASGKASGGLM